MEPIRNLICLDRDRASVIRLKNDEMQFVKKDGEVDFPITVDFWEWWKRVVSYVDGDPVDLCFVYDKNYDLLQENDVIENNILNAQESAWKFEHIKHYFWELKPTYINLMIVGENQQECALDGDKSIANRRFYTNLDFKVQNVRTKPSKEVPVEVEEHSEEEPLEEADITPFAKYFRDLIRKERG